MPCDRSIPAFPARARAGITLALAVAGVALGAGPAAAASGGLAPTGPASDAPRFPAGVAVWRTDLSGLTQAEARDRVVADIAERLAGPVTIVAHGRRIVLSPRRAGIRVNAAALVARAWASAQRALRRQPGATTVKVALGLRLAPSRAAVRAFVARADRRTRVRARNARLIWGVNVLRTTRPRSGRRLAGRGRLGAVVLATLVNPAAPRVLRWRVRLIKPVTRRTLARRYPLLITVSRAEHKVRVWRRLRVVRRYKVAVGQPAYPTPTGLFHVIAKQVNPAWSVPNSSWAGSLGGSTVPGGSPDNPLKARWIGITGSVGFHGTGDLGSLGSNASHGCVRMRVPDVINLYRRVHIGTPVYIR
jgi:lipoprotein-anchoring transpeptidase ErfK/SrfK